MDEKQLQALANELAKKLKTPEDPSQFDRLLKKLSVEAALNAEMTHHPGYEKNKSRPGANSRNGYSTKTVITGDGPLELRTPRDRDGTFEPQLVKKNQTRITGMDNQILSLYAKGMTTREIATAFKELYDADVSPALISKVTDAVMELVVEWQNRPLDAVSPIVYLDCIVLKVRQDSCVINKSVFLAHTFVKRFSTGHIGLSLCVAWRFRNRLVALGNWVFRQLLIGSFSKRCYKSCNR